MRVCRTLRVSRRRGDFFLQLDSSGDVCDEALLRYCLGDDRCTVLRGVRKRSAGFIGNGSVRLRIPAGFSLFDSILMSASVLACLFITLLQLLVKIV